MATGPLRFRTPHIEELPSVQTKQAPGFAWVAVAGGPATTADPAKNWGTTNRKRARAAAGGAGGGQTDSQREALTARQQRDIERKIKELNNDGAGRDVALPAEKKAGGLARVGKTANTKKILASGKTFAHYLDDEEAEIARTGKRDGDVEMQAYLPIPPPPPQQQQQAQQQQQQRPSKTPIARRKPVQTEEKNSPAPTNAAPRNPSTPALSDAMEVDHAADSDGDNDDGNDPIPPLPSQSEIEALLNAPPLSYNQARSAPPPSGVPPPRKFCEICGHWGRVKCMKCGNWTCSVLCKDAHDEHKCLKFYA